MASASIDDIGGRHRWRSWAPMAAALTRVATIRRCQNRCRRTPDFGKNFARKTEARASPF